jgi:hypothetical protein
VKKLETTLGIATIICIVALIGMFTTPGPLSAQDRGYTPIGGRVGTDTRIVGIDPSTEVLSTISYDHHEVHDGSSYLVGQSFQLAALATRTYLLDPSSATKLAHLNMAVSSTVFASYELTEAPTVTASGSVLHAINRRRTVTASPTMTIYQAPTTTAAGSVVETSYNGGTASNGQQSRSGLEYILDPSKNYLLTVTNYGAVCSFSVKLDWYEHADRN